MRSWRHALVLAIGLTACSKADDPKKAEYWIDKLDKRQERAEALRNLGDIKDKAAVPHVTEWLKKEGDWQPEAAYALGQLGDPASVKDLVAAIDFEVRSGEDNSTRRKNRLNASIVRALGLLEAKSESESIKRLLGAPSERVREAALGALGDLGDRANTAAIADKALNDLEPIVRLAAIQALGELGDPAGVPALVQLLYTELPNASFYDAARYSLVRIGEPAVPELLRALERKHAKVEALKLPDGKSMPDGAIEARAASTLGAIRSPSAEGAMIAALGKVYDRARKPNAGAALRAGVVELAYALGNLGTPAVTAALLPLVKDTNPDIRLAACEALITTGNRAVVKDLLAAARTGNTQARAAAVVAVSRMGGADDLAAYDALAKAGDKLTSNQVMNEMVTNERVRLLAAKACGRDAACWKQKLAEPDSRVRERAAYELGWLNAKDAAIDLMTSAEDQDAEVRMAAILSLHRFSGLDAARLQGLYDRWQAKLEYAGVNQELLKLIARQKSTSQK